MQAYHGVLQQLGVKPQRSLEDDMKLQTNVMSYGGNGKVDQRPAGDRRREAASGEEGLRLRLQRAGTCDGEGGGGRAPTAQVDFTKMTAAQKVAYHKARWDRILG